MELAVVDKSGKKTSKKVKLSKDVFEVTPNDHAIYLDVKLHRANQRQGTHKSKERAEIAGSTRKIKKQKGTGTARAGSLKNPLFRGGGRIFGPRPKDYGFKLNKKLRKVARMSALSYKAKDNAILAIEDFKFDAAKTKDYAAILNALEVAGKRSLVVVSENDENLVLSARNLQNTKVVVAGDLNTYDILNAKALIISEGSFKQIEDNLLSA